MPRTLLSWLFLFCCSVPAWALKFRILGEGNNRILLLYDCDLLEDQCEDYENAFMSHMAGSTYEGDPAVFRRALRQPGVREVWIVSGGGIVQASIEMARDLRHSHLPVRVPNAAALHLQPKFHPYCVSACTVFFMGGVIRRIDPGATYQVHSASLWAEGVDWHMKAPDQPPTIDKRIETAAKMPRESLSAFADGQQKQARIMALQILRVFQNTLLIPTRRPPVPEDFDGIEADATTQVPALTYPESRQEEQDVRRIQAEGRAAVQDILMRIEREQMAAAIHWLEGRTDLGYRADTALEMLRLMYMESIRETSTLSRSELERRGYVTPEVQ